jgi:hypothetical protein
LVDKYAAIAKIEWNILNRLRHKQHWLTDRMSDPYLAEHISVPAGEVGNKDCGRFYARLDVIHDVIRPEYVVAAFASEATLADYRPNNVFVDDL